jgi:hypothetical protein
MAPPQSQQPEPRSMHPSQDAFLVELICKYKPICNPRDGCMDRRDDTIWKPMAEELAEKMPEVIRLILEEEPAARGKRATPDTKQLKRKWNDWKNEFWEAKRLVDLQFTVPTGCAGKSCDETSALLDDTLDEALRAGQQHFKYFSQFYAAFGKAAATFDSSRLHETITPTKAPHEPQACNMPTWFNSSKTLGEDVDPPSEHGSSDGMDPTDQWNAMHGICIDSDDECTCYNVREVH